MENDNRGNKYFDMDSMKPETEQVRRDNKEKKGLFFSGMIVGLAAAFLIVSVAYLGTRLQNLVESEDTPAAEQVAFEEDSAIDAELLSKMQKLEDTIDKYFY